MKVLPRHVICVLGDWKNFSGVESIVKSFGDGFTFDSEYSQLAPDKRMKDAFNASVDRSNPTINGAELRTISAHTAVAYVLSPPIRKAEAESISATALLLTSELIKHV